MGYSKLSPAGRDWAYVLSSGLFKTLASHWQGPAKVGVSHNVVQIPFCPEDFGVGEPARYMLKPVGQTVQDFGFLSFISELD